MSSKDLSNSGRKFSSKRHCKRRTFGPKQPSKVVSTKTADCNQTAGPSSKKMKCTDEDKIPLDICDGFRIVHLHLLERLVSAASVCKVCKRGTLSIGEDHSRKMGLASMLSLTCDSCPAISESYTSPQVEGSKGYEINRRIVLGMLEIGGGKTSMEKLCAILNMPGAMADKAYMDNLNTVKDALETSVSSSMREAAAEEHSLQNVNADTVIDCKSMFDGTWRKRGFSSLQGAVTAISGETGKCFDYESMNKFCASCSLWKSRPDGPEKEAWASRHECPINYHGSAPAMEPEGIKRVYARSESINKLRYTGYIGDGDTKSFSTIKASKPYGDSIEIEKFECVGHVQKRMGNALRKLKSKHGSRKLSDGKTIGGRGRLTGEVMDKLQTYYGLAIRRNKHDLEGMKKEIWAGLYHSASTDEKPQHQNCPTGEESWCKYNRAKANSKTYSHTKYLPSTIVELLTPIYERLSKDETLKGCLGGFTQNGCEALNHLIWARCPKAVSSGRAHLDSACASAVLAFNDGNSALSTVMDNMGVNAGCHMARFMQKLDQKRIRESDARASEIEKKIRKSKRRSAKASQDSMLEKEGVTYEPGGFS